MNIEERVEMFVEIVAIYKKYFNIIEQLGTITMSPQDKERLEYLENKLGK